MPRTATRAGSRSCRTPGHACPRGAPGGPGTARSSSGSAPSNAAATDASPRAPREAPSPARPGTAAGRTRKAPGAPGCGPAPAAETGSRRAGTRSPRSARATSPAPGSRCDRGPRPASSRPPRSLRREGCRAQDAAGRGQAGLRHPAMKKVASPPSPSCSSNRWRWVEPVPKARWRHLLPHSGGTTRRGLKPTSEGGAGRCGPWGGNRRTALFAHRDPQKSATLLG